MHEDTPYTLGYAAFGMWNPDPETIGYVPAGSPTPREARDRNVALDALTAGQSFIYAMRLKDSIVKIGWSNHLANRRAQLRGQILAFKPGSYYDEQDIHTSLSEHRARGREYYHPRPEVMAVVNEMRGHFNLPAIAA